MITISGDLELKGGGGCGFVLLASPACLSSICDFFLFAQTKGGSSPRSATDYRVKMFS